MVTVKFLSQVYLLEYSIYPEDIPRKNIAPSAACTHQAAEYISILLSGFHCLPAIQNREILFFQEMHCFLSLFIHLPFQKDTIPFRFFSDTSRSPHRKSAPVNQYFQSSLPYILYQETATLILLPHTRKYLCSVLPSATEFFPILSITKICSF